MFIYARSSDQELLAFAAVLAIAFSLAAAIAFADTDRALRLQPAARLADMELRWLPGRRLILILGSALLAFAAVANVIVAPTETLS